MSLRLDKPFGQHLHTLGRPAVGMWVCSGSPVAAEICAGAGLDYLLIDGEHAPLSLENVQAQLRTIAGYRVPTMVRVPALDPVLIKQFLDLGAQTLIVPMVDDAEMAAAAVAAARARTTPSPRPPPPPPPPPRPTACCLATSASTRPPPKRPSAATTARLVR